MMEQSSLLDFSKTIKTHATIIGVLLVLSTISTFVLGASWDLIVEHSTNIDNAKLTQTILLVVGAINLLFTTIYLIGFLKRIRWCITVCLVFVIPGFVLQALSLVLALISLSMVHILQNLISFGISGYFLLVLVQMRKMMSNGLLADSEQV
uniref:Uncharacterized protein n=1 Tax=Anopheles atroparvus TaxID=41427 RepID=A0AAG5D6Y2_ANOAO